MSELKVFDCQGCLYHDEHFFYSKSEADKVIEKKDKEIAKLKEQVALLQAEFVPQPGV